MKFYELLGFSILVLTAFITSTTESYVEMFTYERLLCS